MNISLKSEYAMAALFDLATQDPRIPIKIGDIARRQKVPQKFLELILAGLKQGGFVESRRGAEGGYLLARAPRAILVGEILRFVEGGKEARKRRKENPFTDFWARVDKAISDVVDQTTLDDVVRTWREKQGRYVPNWDI